MGKDYEKLCDWSNLYESYKMARRGKRWKNSVARVEANALEAVAILQKELQEHTYRPGGYREFYVYEPKKRLIQTNSFKDKIVQHCLCDFVLYSAITKPFILDNYGSQIGKGTHYGLDRLKGFMQEYYRRHGSADGWVLKADVRNYFGNIRHDILKQDIAKQLRDPEILALCYQIIDSVCAPKVQAVRYDTGPFGQLRMILDEPEKPAVGIPIGNQSSQLFALLYLNRLDHMVKEQLRFRYYGRYMDDFYIIDESKEKLQAALKIIRQHLAERGLELNGKTQIFPLRNGLDFLGFHSYLNDDGQVIRKVRKASRERMKRKLHKFGVMYEHEAITREEIAESYQSWRSHALHGDCRQLVAKFDTIYKTTIERSKDEHVQNIRQPGGGHKGN